MPRTKISSKNQKRNRELANEEIFAARLCEFDALVDDALQKFDMKSQHAAENLSTEIATIKNRLPSHFLKMKLSDLESLNIKNIEQFNQMEMETPLNVSSVNHLANRTMNKTIHQSVRKISKDDEGYLTEDNARNSNSTQSSSSSAAAAAASRRGRGRTPQLSIISSTKVKSRRRSQSASGCLNNVTTGSGGASAKPIASIRRASRSQMRTPIINRIKSASADRLQSVTPKVTPNTPVSLLRYPKAGELVISLSGSPVVAQRCFDPLANVNIPTKDGVLSVQPTKMHSFDPELLTKIDQDTLNQIKQLQNNLNVIMSCVDKAFS